MKNGKVPQNSIAIYGASVAVSLVLSYVESIIPINLGIPGAKIGLPNIVTIFLLYTAGARGALAVSVMRILLSGFMFGNMFSIVYSLSGLLLSFAGMVLLRQTGRFSTMGVSIAGGILHNMGQLICAVLVAGPYVAVYLPALLLAGCLAGTVVGLLGAETVKRVGRYLR